MSGANTIGRVHLRRALLLFAIVLGMAALAASLSRPANEPAEREPRPDPGPATAAPTPSSAPPAAISFDATADESRRILAGQAATLEVTVDEPGSVEIPELGLSTTADRLTVARFEVLPAKPGEYEIVFTPSEDRTARPAGKLVVRSAG
jgi:hypothetical protein